MLDKPLLRKIRTNISENSLISPGCHVIAGISGGADSVCLLAALTEIRDEYGLSVTAVHVNHMLRGPESDADEEFTVQLCEKLGTPLRIFRRDIRKISGEAGISEEEAGREARYSLLREVMEETGADVIAVAHNFEDQAETVMMNILRGCGTEGLAGMGFKNGPVIRPLLNVRRIEILDYLAGLGQEYRTDSSNASLDYARNRVRNMLFPCIRENFSVDPAGMLNRLSTLIRRDDDFLSGFASGVFSKVFSMKDGLAVMDVSDLGSLEAAVSSRIARLAWERLTGSKKRLEAVHVDGILELIRGNATGKSVSLPSGMAAWISYGKLYLGRKDGKRPPRYSYPAAVPGVTDIPEARGALKARIIDRDAFTREFRETGALKENSETQIFDYLKTNCGINIRSRRDGDRIRPKGSPGEKKLKEFFIDQKIPAGARDFIPLVASGQDIIWVVGMRTSEKFRPDDRTMSYLVLSWAYK